MIYVYSVVAASSPSGLQAVAAECVLSRQSHELFALTHEQPHSMFPVPLPFACFRRVVVSTSVYVGVDRVVVIELLRGCGLYGGRVDDRIRERELSLGHERKQRVLGMVVIMRSLDHYTNECELAMATAVAGCCCRSIRAVLSPTLLLRPGH